MEHAAPASEATGHDADELIALFGFDDALGALMFCWGDLYEITMVNGWSAKRLDGSGEMITAQSAHELNLAIRERELIRAGATEGER